MRIESSAHAHNHAEAYHDHDHDHHTHNGEMRSHEDDAGEHTHPSCKSTDGTTTGLWSGISTIATYLLLCVYSTAGL